MARISQNEAKKLCQNFLDTKSAAMDKIVGKEDANAIWFEIKDLEDFLSYAKREANNQKETVNGIRVYLGSYDTTHENKDLAGRTTIFLSATIAGTENLGNALDLNADAFNMGLLGVPPKRFY
jgi:hypothetical protein